MMTNNITDTELGRRLTEVLERVRRGERFVIEHDGEAIAAIEPVKPGITWQEFVELWRTLPRPDDKFADDLEAVLAERPQAEMPEWPS